MSFGTINLVAGVVAVLATIGVVIIGWRLPERWRWKFLWGTVIISGLWMCGAPFFRSGGDPYLAGYYVRITGLWFIDSVLTVVFWILCGLLAYLVLQRLSKRK